MAGPLLRRQRLAVDCCGGWPQGSLDRQAFPWSRALERVRFGGSVPGSRYLEEGLGQATHVSPSPSPLLLHHPGPSSKPLHTPLFPACNLHCRVARLCLTGRLFPMILSFWDSCSIAAIVLLSNPEGTRAGVGVRLTSALRDPGTYPRPYTQALGSRLSPTQSACLPTNASAGHLAQRNQSYNTTHTP